MPGKYRAYPEYKDSRVEWLGKIPSHWYRLKFKFFAKQGRIFASGPFGSNIGSQFYTDEGVPVIRGNNLSLDGDKPQYIDNGYVFLTEKKADELSNAEVLPGDLVFTARGTVGQVGLVPRDGTIKWSRAILSANQLRFRNNNSNLSSPFLWYLFSSWFLRTQIILSSDSVAQPNLNLGSLKDLQILFTGYEEQQKIANFLDHETAKIDTLIEKQQQLIKLLKEKRQAVISHAVTKGLNPNAKMRDSGVDWLGEVPEHWALKNYRYATKIYRGKFGHRPRNDPAFYDGNYPFIQTGDIARAGKRITTYSQTLNEKGVSVSQKFPAGTLVMAIAANIGDTAILNFEAYAPDSVVGFKPNHDIDLEFLRYSLLAALPALEQTSTQSTQANLNIDRIGTVKASFPPLEEQRVIINKLDNLLERYADIELKAVRAIELMQERRTALISAAVTGKIDVRNWQAPNG